MPNWPNVLADAGDTDAAGVRAGTLENPKLDSIDQVSGLASENYSGPRPSLGRRPARTLENPKLDSRDQVSGLASEL
jgi:hypothetical protein